MFTKNKSIYNLRVILLVLILIQSFGIRLVEGQGIGILLLIIALYINTVRKFSIRHFRYLFIILVFISISKLINSNFSTYSFIYELLLIIASFLFIFQYKGKETELQYDLFYALKIVIYHATIGYFIYLIFPGFFSINIDSHKSFGYIFYVSNGTFFNLFRNTGFFWEPGVFQLIANLFLFYCIKFNKKYYMLIIGTFAVISSFSTTGLALLSLNFIYYFYINYKHLRKSFSSILIAPLIITLFIPVLNANLSDKINEENTSGLVRLRDFQIGIELIMERPIIGHGLFNAEYLSTKQYVNKIEDNLFYTTYIDLNGEMSGGFTNGFLGFISAFGIPISIFVFIFIFKNRFVDKPLIEKIIFFTIIIGTMFSEPISLTFFFFMLPLSYLILKTS